MKHLHYKFILASIALGFGWAFIFGSVWNIHAMPMAGLTPVRTYLSALLSSLVGIILVSYGWQGIRGELNGK